jgi:hypothetical protein
MFIRPFPTSHAAARANRRSRIATLSSFVVAGTVTFLVLAGFAKIIPAAPRAGGRARDARRDAGARDHRDARRAADCQGHRNALTARRR